MAVMTAEAAYNTTQQGERGMSKKESKSKSSSRNRSKSPTASDKNKSSSRSRMPWKKKDKPPPELPQGWKKYRDPSSGNAYYANKKTGESSWERPKADGKKSATDKKKKADKKPSDIKVEMKRHQSTSSKSSISSIPSMEGKELSIEYTREVQTSIHKTVSFASENQVRMFKPEPIEPDESVQVSPTKKKKSKHKKKATKSSATVSKRKRKFTQETSKAVVKKHREIQEETEVVLNKSSLSSDSSVESTSFKPFKLGWRKKRRAKVVSSKEKSAPGKPVTKTAPSSLLGIRNKSLGSASSTTSTDSQAKTDQVDLEAESVVFMSKIAALPPSPDKVDNKSITETASEISKSETESETPFDEPPSTAKEVTPPNSPAQETPPTSPESEATPEKTTPSDITPTPTDTPTSPSRTSKIASLLKTPTREGKKVRIQQQPTSPKLQIFEPDKSAKSVKSVPSSNKTWPVRSKSAKKKESPEKTVNKSLLDPPEEEQETTQDGADGMTSPSRKVSKLKALSSFLSNSSQERDALTSTLLDSKEFISQERDNADPEPPAEVVTKPVVTPQRTLQLNRTFDSEGGSPASSRLASSLSLCKLMLDKDLEVESSDADSIFTEKEQPPSNAEDKPKSEGAFSTGRLVSMFKKKRSNDSKESSTDKQDEVVQESADVQPKSVEKEEPKPENDGDTQTTGSSASGIEIEPSEPGWIIEDDLGYDEELKPEESRCGDCGCSQSMHEHLLFIGGLIYKVVGKPNDDMRRNMEEVGDLFADEDDSQDVSEY